MPQTPIAIEPMAAFFSASENFLDRINVAIPTPIGGRPIAMAMGPKNAQFSPAATIVPTIATPVE